jgi:radical S-adenosyl methionine domain-containing protein 2
VAENNAKMRDSYLILDERMRFLDCTGGEKKPSMSVLDVGVAAAMNDSGFDRAMFIKRGGIYKWSKEPEHSLEW